MVFSIHNQKRNATIAPAVDLARALQVMTFMTGLAGGLCGYRSGKTSMLVSKLFLFFLFARKGPAN